MQNDLVRKLNEQLGNKRKQAAADFNDPQHQGQRGCDWDAGFVAAWTIVTDLLGRDGVD